MSDIAIRVNGLGKLYRISHQRQAGYKTLGELLSGLFRRNGHASNTTEEFWALRDLSVDINRGEVVGVIGRNGAGKSTFLKLLSRITPPTTGSVEFRGRVSSLLEVGTGFHPELSGRENIFLNGAILGMPADDIRRKFDEIVAFAEVEQFLDTPVKRYSSGMYMRLAFAVAAHLEPDILLVDEVLAVGDVAFQKKCLGKMQEVATREKRTVLFVSHNMTAVARLCNRTIWLSGGQLRQFGPTAEVLRHYQSSAATGSSVWERQGDPTDNAVSFARIWVEVPDPDRPGQFMEAVGPVNADSRFRLVMKYRLNERIVGLSMTHRVTNGDGIPVFSSSDTDAARRFDTREPGDYFSHVELSGHFLAPGRYTVQTAAHVPFRRVYALLDDCITLEISSVGSLTAIDNRLGVVVPDLPWRTQPMAPDRMLEATGIRTV